MKKIINEKNLINKINEAVNTLCDTVIGTLGPKGQNVIIDHSACSPFITNDGVTIAQNIESEDEIINTIFEIVKTSSVKTDDIIGDGTTTTLLLLKNIYNEGRKYINEGINPIMLKKELNVSLNKLIKEIKSLSFKPKKQDLKIIAMISSNSKNIGNIISNTYFKIKNIDGITLEENENEFTETIFYKGYKFETIIASDYFFKENIINFKNAKILLTKSTIDNLEDISYLLNKIINNNQKLIIIAKDYSDDIINNFLSLYLENKINIILLKNPHYGENQKYFLDDIKAISNSYNINNYWLGEIENIKICKNETIICYKKNENITNRIKTIKDNNEFNKNERISMLQNGLATIKIGGNTTVEKREALMRYQDALKAINIAKNGVLIGSGISLLKLKKQFKIETNGDEIIYNILDTVFDQIIYNSGNNILEIKNKIIEENYNIVYDVKNEKFINCNHILDPTLAVIEEFKNAISIASMLLTTNSLIINEYKNINYDDSNIL